MISLAFAVVVMGADNESESRGFSLDVSTSQIETALKNDRYLKRQLQCALGTHPCDAVGKKIKGKFIYSFKYIFFIFSFLSLSEFYFFSHCF